MTDLRFQCVTCGKLTAGGRLPREGHVPGDGSERYPRLHRIDGAVCPGSYDYARWVEGNRSWESAFPEA